MRYPLGMLHKEFRVYLEFISYIGREDCNLGCLLSKDYLLCLTDLKNTRRDIGWGNSKKYRFCSQQHATQTKSEIVFHSTAVLIRSIHYIVSFGNVKCYLRSLAGDL